MFLGEEVDVQEVVHLLFALVDSAVQGLDAADTSLLNVSDHLHHLTGLLRDLQGSLLDGLKLVAYAVELGYYPKDSVIICRICLFEDETEQKYCYRKVIWCVMTIYN